MPPSESPTAHTGAKMTASPVTSLGAPMAQTVTARAVTYSVTIRQLGWGAGHGNGRYPIEDKFDGGVQSYRWYW